MSRARETYLCRLGGIAGGDAGAPQYSMKSEAISGIFSSRASSRDCAKMPRKYSFLSYVCANLKFINRLEQFVRRGGVRLESTVFLVGAVSYTVKSGWRGVSGVSLVGAASYTVKSGWLCVIHSEIWLALRHTQ
jgi:hypothetical protein